RPASASFKMPMICSSVNRFFIAVPLWNGLYTVTVLNAGSRSHAAGQNLSDPADRDLIDRQSGHLPALALFAAQMQKPPPFGRGFLA
ncbi:hypothetical protein, partial [Burkholderia diffusa]|uniref:hypothetical protein n=1 Tax=Burkholderia diffusa TaxID=488732 RepID=UPI001C2E0B3E